MAKMLDNYIDIEQLKKYSYAELEQLAKEIRMLIIKRCTTVGGHLATNLGIVETTLMLYRHFNPFNGFIVYDAEHQGYTHKILTGRKDDFCDSNLVGTLNMVSESEVDRMNFGHVGMGASFICGVARTTDLPCVLFLSDGAFANGIEYEGLCQIATLKRNVVVVYNDNGVAIYPTSGGQFDNQKQQSKENIFRAMGFDYVESNGYDLQQLDKSFQYAFAQNKPTVVHVHTVKGKGYIYAEKNPLKFHFIENKFNMLKGDNDYADSPDLHYMDNVINDLMNEDENLYAMSVSMPDTGMRWKVEKQKNWFEVGMTEEHAFVEACAMSRVGKYCIIGTYSTFSQRMYDCISNLGETNDVSTTLLLYESGLRDSNIYQSGFYDVCMANQFERVTLLCPVTINDAAEMLKWTIKQKGIYMIRIPNDVELGEVIYGGLTYKKLNKYGDKPLYVLSLGNTLESGKCIAEFYQGEHYYCSNNKIDEKFFKNIEENSTIIVLEDGCVNGGFGQKVMHYCSEKKVNVLGFGIEHYDFLTNPNDKQKDEVEHHTFLDLDYIKEKIEKVI